MLHNHSLSALLKMKACLDLVWPSSIQHSNIWGHCLVRLGPPSCPSGATVWPVWGHRLACLGPPSGLSGAADVWGGRRLGRQTSGAADVWGGRRLGRHRLAHHMSTLNNCPCYPHYEDVLVAVDNMEHQHTPVLTGSEHARTGAHFCFN